MFLLIRLCYGLNYVELFHATALPGHCTGHLRVTVNAQTLMHRRYNSVKEKQILPCSSSYLTSRIFHMALVQPAEGAKNLMSIWKWNNWYMWLFWSLCLQRSKKRHAHRWSWTMQHLPKNLSRKCRNCQPSQIHTMFRKVNVEGHVHVACANGWRHLKLWGKYETAFKRWIKVIAGIQQKQMRWFLVSNITFKKVS